MKELTESETATLRHFIRFCDGIHDTGKKSKPLLRGSGLGAAQLGDVFRNEYEKRIMHKALRRGLIERDGHLWKPTEAGRVRV